MEKFKELLIEIYSSTFGISISLENLHSKNRNRIEVIYSYLETVAPRAWESQADVWEYYLRKVCAYLARSSNFYPTLSLLASRRMLITLMDDYSKGKKLTPAEIYITKSYVFSRDKEPKDFFGYSYSTINKFSRQHPEYTMCSLLLKRQNEGKIIDPSKVIIDMLDRVFFHLLGVNFLEECKDKIELTTSYTELTEILNLKRNLEERRKMLESVNIFDALGYKLVTKIGKNTLTYCDLLLWKRSLDKEDMGIKEYIVDKIRRKITDWDVFYKNITSRLEAMRASIPADEYETVQRVLLQTWMVEVTNAYKSFKEGRMYG